MCEVEDRTLTSFGLDFLPTLTNLGGAACALCAWSVRNAEELPSVAPRRLFANPLILSTLAYLYISANGVQLQYCYNCLPPPALNFPSSSTTSERQLHSLLNGYISSFLVTTNGMLQFDPNNSRDGFDPCTVCPVFLVFLFVAGIRPGASSKERHFAIPVNIGKGIFGLYVLLTVPHHHMGVKIELIIPHHFSIASFVILKENPSSLTLNCNKTEVMLVPRSCSPTSCALPTGLFPSLNG